MTLAQLFDLVERHALVPCGSSAPVRAKRATVGKWLREVIACPVDWRERVAAVPKGQGIEYAYLIICAASDRRIRMEQPPTPAAVTI